MDSKQFTDIAVGRNSRNCYAARYAAINISVFWDEWKQEQRVMGAKSHGNKEQRLERNTALTTAIITSYAYFTFYIPQHTNFDLPVFFRNYQ